MTDQYPYELISPGSAGEGEDLLANKSSSEGLRRVQALLADWLRMENVVVLTGAGCSVGCGGRLMSGPVDNNIECVVLDAIKQCPLSAAAKSIVDWKMANGFGTGDFESWLSFVFNGFRLTSTAGSPIDAVLWKRKHHT